MSQSFLARLPLSRYEIDRDYLSREREELFEELWADPRTRILPVFQGTALLSTPTSLALLPVGAIPEPELLVYLGLSTSESSPEPAGTPIVAALLSDAGHLAEAEWANLRRLGNTLSDRDAGLLTEALGVLNWHSSHGFSPRTGEPTIVAKGGWVRRDPVSNTEVFPRTDSAIIVGVLDADDRILLGSNALWESNRYSLLAGFVEPGESLEAAVQREVFEEAGLRVIEPHYLGSQPWPFPASLMMGFTARLDPTVTNAAVPDGAEILDLRWFSRDELHAALGEIILPGPTSIARAIIDEWFGEPIDDGQV
ncbi:MAG TPA: NAD(+) diphosphatase [Glaciihabitans sp.]|jgi:NAD+ diphosphatase|nr:NAD(+) diphosphatase [Glaciihabitans sp.]